MRNTGPDKDVDFPLPHYNQLYFFKNIISSPDMQVPNQSSNIPQYKTSHKSQFR